MRVMSDADSNLKIKGVWLPVLAMALLQICGAVAIVSVNRADISHLSERLTEARQEMREARSEVSLMRDRMEDSTRYRYTSEDASRDRTSILALIAAVNERIAASEARLARLEGGT